MDGPAPDAAAGTWDALPRIRIPVLVTNGTEDVVLPPANAVLLQQQIKNATLDMFSGAGHGMLFQDANRFVTLVSAFAG
jgi:pimeloyl-ACP methyl ester carboxylesterase